MYTGWNFGTQAYLPDVPSSCLPDYQGDLELVLSQNFFWWSLPDPLVDVPDSCHLYSRLQFAESRLPLLLPMLPAPALWSQQAAPGYVLPAPGPWGQ